MYSDSGKNDHRNMASGKEAKDGAHHHGSRLYCRTGHCGLGKRAQNYHILQAHYHYFFLIGGQLLPFLLYSKANQLYVYTYLLCLEPPTPFHSSRSSQSTSMSPLCYEPAPHELADLHMVWRRQWHPTPVLLPGKSHERRSLVGCSPWGH